MAMVLGCILALVSLLITPALLFYFDVTPKIAVLLLGVAILLPWFAARLGLGKLAESRAGRWFCALLGAQELSLLLSTVLCRNPVLSLGGTNWRRLGPAAWTAIALFTLITAALISSRPGSRLVVMRSIAASGLLAAGYGISQYLGWDPWLPASAYHIGEGVWTIVRPPGTAGYATYFATYSLAVVFVSAGLAATEKAGPWKWLGAGAALAGLIAIPLSGTRAAIAGLACGGLFWLLWFRPRVRVSRAAIVAAGAAAAMVLFYYSGLGTQLRSRTRWYLEDPRGGARLLLWRDSLRMSLHRPVLGYGPETFSSEFPRFQSVALAQAYPDFYHESPHNIFLDALAAQGLPGLALLSGLCLLGFQAAWRARERDLAMAGALGAALAAVLVAQQFSSFVLVTALHTYVLIGLLVGSRAAEAPAARPRARRAAVAVALAVAVWLALVAVRLCAADRALAAARRDLDAGRLDEAVREYGRACRWQPAGAGSDLWYSRRLAVFAQSAPEPGARLVAWRLGMSAAVRATETAEDRQNAWYNLAAFYASQNDFAHTEAALRTAAAWAPNWFKPHWMLAQTLRAAGRLPEAESEAVLARRLDGGKNPEVALTLKQIQEDRRRVASP